MLRGAVVYCCWQNQSERLFYFTSYFLPMFPAHERTSTLRLIVIALALVGVLMLILRPGSSAQRLVSRWQPQPLLTAPEPQAQQPGAPAPEPIAGDARPLDQFDIQVDDGLYADERAAPNGDLQAALGYVV
ncbi:hypothetical protein SE17_37410, partial [Kouleothrix aurantiaca]